MPLYTLLHTCSKVLLMGWLPWPGDTSATSIPVIDFWLDFDRGCAFKLPASGHFGNATFFKWKYFEVTSGEISSRGECGQLDKKNYAYSARAEKGAFKELVHMHVLVAIFI